MILFTSADLYLYLYQEKNDPIICEEINDFTDEEQANLIAEHFALPRNKYSALQPGDVQVPSFLESSILQFSQANVQHALNALNVRKSVPPGDIPTAILKKCSKELSIPVTNVLNSAIKQGVWPTIFKTEYVTPVPKVFPPKKLKNLRSISGLMTFDKIFEKLIGQAMIEDMKTNIDPSQFGNKNGLSTQHYLVKMVDKILRDTDSAEVTAVLATFVDWKDAFPNQCPKLGIEAFMKCGVRHSLIPVLIDYFRGRSIIVKWHGNKSKQKQVDGGGPQGGLLGILEYKAQSNESANSVPKDSRYKFVDDLTTLEKIALLSIGICSHNIKQQVPNDINVSNLFIPQDNLKTQHYINQIAEWTNCQKMTLNEEKTKSMVFNIRKNKQFSTRLTLNNKHIETVTEFKLLGTYITSDLKGNKNTKYLVKRAYARMELLRQMTKFTKSTWDKLIMYKVYIRSILEQSCTVWNSSLTKKNERELERVQKVAVKLIIRNKNTYEENLNELKIQTLKERRNTLSLNFAKNCLLNEKNEKICS